MNTSAAGANWESFKSYWYNRQGDLSIHYIQYERQPGVYLKAFNMEISAHPAGSMGADTGDVKGYGGVWNCPYNTATTVNNSTRVLSVLGMTAGQVRTATVSVQSGAMVGLTYCSGTSAVGFAGNNYKFLYAVYPGDGSVTPSSASGALGGAQTVKFSTPTACSWPTPYAGTTNGHNSAVYGSLWPDVLVTRTTDGTEPPTPEYTNANTQIVTYAATGSANGNKTTASLNLAANQTYTVKVRLAVDNSGNRKDVEYGKVNTFTYYTYAAPTASPAAGSYTTPQQVTLSGATSGQVIRYTTDGSNPTASSPAYTAPIAVKNTTIKAQKYSGTTPVSPVATYSYAINPSAVVASPGAGAYWNTQAISLSCAGGYELYYTLDGSAPTQENSTKYTVPIFITDTAKLRVQRYFDGEPVGSVVDLSYTIQIPAVKADPSAGAVGQGTKIALSPAAGNAANNDLYYTENDALPYDSWTPYTVPIEITKDITLYAVARDKISGRFGEKSTFTYQYSELGYILNDLSFWQGSTKVTSTDIAALAGKTMTAKANITKIIPSVQGWLVTALYDSSGHAQQIKLDKLDQISGIATGDAVGKAITLPADTSGYVLKTFIVHDFAQLRPIGAVVQIGEKMEEQ